jgi:hypothetical protein
LAGAIFVYGNSKGAFYHLRSLFYNSKAFATNEFTPFENPKVCTPSNPTYPSKFLSINCGSRYFSSAGFVSLMFCMA